MSIVTMLDTIAASRRVTARLAVTLAKEFSPDANLFDALGYAETHLSRFIAWLLTPGERHGQGTSYLNLFLRQFALSGDQWPLDALAKVSVRTEVATLKQDGFIDVLIEHPTCGMVAIESKPFAAFQDRQIKRYLTDVRQRAPGRGQVIALIGWQGDATGHLAKHLGEDEKNAPGCDCAAYGFDALARWADDCRTASHSLRMHDLLSQFGQHIRRRYGYGGQDMNSTTIVEHALSSLDRLEAALAIVAAGEAIKREVVNQATTRLLATLAAYDPRDDGFASGKPAGHLSFDVGLGRTRLFLWFDQGNYRMLSFGLRDASRVGDDRQVRHNAASQMLQAQFGRSQYQRHGWSYWRKLDAQGPFPGLDVDDPIAVGLFLASDDVVDGFRELLDLITNVGQG